MIIKVIRNHDYVDCNNESEKQNDTNGIMMKIMIMMIIRLKTMMIMIAD